MKPESEHYLNQAREDLDDARKIAAIPLAKIAARSAYYAAFHAAEAYIYERTDKVARTHSGVRAELARLIRDEPQGREALPAFLARAYRFKEISDYGKAGETVSEVELSGAIEGAQRFLDEIVSLLSPGG